MSSEERDLEEVLRTAVETKDILAACNLLSTVSVTKDGQEEAYTLQSFSGTEIVGKVKSRVYSILEENMQEMYIAASWGWDESAKRKEIFHPLSRFLVLLTSDGKVAAYVTFRFEWDDEDEPEYPVLFLYEIQVAEEYRGRGLGTILMDHLKKIADHFELRKILLTVFKINTRALEFYKKVGFGIDANSPSSCGFHDETYEILSNKPKKKRR